MPRLPAWEFGLPRDLVVISSGAGAYVSGILALRIASVNAQVRCSGPRYQVGDVQTA